VLTHRYPPLSVRGFTVLFTGLSGAGKSTIAQIVAARLAERGDRPVTVLDGDVVRRHLSSELGYTREHRELNVRRVGFVAAEITRNGGAVVCAMIAPYERPRREVREMVRAVGGFLLVHVATSVEVCEERDRKGLYAKARAGLLPEFTGVSDPYESPSDADLVIDTAVESAEDAAERVLAHLAAAGYVLPSDGDTFEVAFDPGLQAPRSTASARGKA
jgi:sulfate adenylyltransferase